MAVLCVVWIGGVVKGRDDASYEVIESLLDEDQQRCVDFRGQRAHLELSTVKRCVWGTQAENINQTTGSVGTYALVLVR